MGQHHLLAEHIAERRRQDRVQRARRRELEAQLAAHEAELANLRMMLGVEVEENTEQIPPPPAPQRVP